MNLYDTVVCGNYGTGISVTQILAVLTSEWNYVSRPATTEGWGWLSA